MRPSFFSDQLEGIITTLKAKRDSLSASDMLAPAVSDAVVEIRIAGLNLYSLAEELSAATRAAADGQRSQPEAVS